MEVIGAAPGGLHKLWKAGRPMRYHMECGYSSMGCEIAGAIGDKMAEPDRDEICFTGDGTYMMANSELATAAMMGIGFTVVVPDNRRFGCIDWPQIGCGGAEFNNLLDHAVHETRSAIDFAADAASMGAEAVKVASIAELEDALAKRGGKRRPYVVVIDTDPDPSTPHGGAWREVGAPEVSKRPEMLEARKAFEKNKKMQRAD